MAGHETSGLPDDLPPHQPAESLVQAYLDGVLTESDRTELVARLRSDPTAADLFARATRFEALLESYLVEERDTRSASPKSAAAGRDGIAAGVGSRSFIRLPQRAGVRIAPAATGLAAAVLIGWAIVAQRMPHDGIPADGHRPPIARAVHEVVSGRVLVDGVEAERFFDGARLEVVGDQGAVIRPAEGAEVELSPGADAVVDTAADEAIVRLAYGTAKVRGDDRRRLRIDTPAGVVSGRGAEFTVDLPSTALSRSDTGAASNTGSPADPGESSLGPNLPALLIVAVLAGQVEVSEGDGKAAEKQPDSPKQIVPAGTSRAFSKEKKPMFAGRVVEAADDGKRITLEGKPGKPGAPPERREVRLTDATESIYHGVPLGADRPTVGYMALVTLDKNDPGSAVSVEYGDKIPTLIGGVREVSADGRTLQVAVYRKGDSPEMRTVTLDERTRTSYTGEGSLTRPTVGHQANIWLADSTPAGASNRAVEIRFTYKSKGPAKSEDPNTEKPNSEKKPPVDQTKPGDKNAPQKKPSPEKKPNPEKKPPGDKTQTEKKSPVDKNKPISTNAPGEKKPGEKPAAQKPNTEKSNTAKPNTEKLNTEKPGSPKTPNPKPETTNTKALKATSPAVRPARRATTRSPAPIAAEIDRAIDERLQKAGIAASSEAGDAEFVRRAALDVAGRIPDLAAARSFLADTDPDKRTKLVDALLESDAYGRRFAAVWKRLIQPRPPAGGKPQIDRFTPWLADEINAGRGWNEIVRELITTEADLVRDGRSYFLAVNSESFDPKPNLLAASTARLFLGVQLGCAECHDHPFAEWKQNEFWNLAAFYGRVHKRSKSDFTWTEEPSDAPAVITIPEGGGKAAGRVVPALYLGGDSPRLESGRPLRHVLADWVTAVDNPYFARAAVNRLWAHFFGRGLVEPLDGFQAGYEASHPEVLDRLAEEFVASDYDLRHMVRIITATRAYRRTSRPSVGNALRGVPPVDVAVTGDDAQLLSRMAVKVLDPDVLYDSLSVALNADLRPPVESGPATPGKKLKISRPEPISIGPRDEFVNFFTGAAGDSGPTRYAHGIPQLLRLMNAETFNVGSPTAKAVAAAGGTIDEKIETIYLAALARRPSPSEIALMKEYVERAGENEQAWSDVLWILLNSSEFLLNR